MKLTVEGLKAAGGFVGSAVERTIKWIGADGEELEGTVWVLPLSYKSAVGDIVNAASNKDAVAGRIASCILGEDMQPIFTVEDITGEADPERGALCESLTMALLAAIGEVSAGKKPAAVRRGRAKKS